MESTGNSYESNVPAFNSLEDQTIKYDMRAMLKEIKAEFDIQLGTADLVDQSLITEIFKSKGASNAGEKGS